jgi:hypothetical protein
MHMAYTIFRKLETGELLRVAARDDLHQAQQLVQSLDEHWPADYTILDSESTAEVERRTRNSFSKAPSDGIGTAATTRASPSLDDWDIT